MRRTSAASSRRLARPRVAALGALAGASVLAALVLACGPPAAAADGAERAAILALGPWPPDPTPLTARTAAVAFGEVLFHSPRLSPTGVRCASCHEPWRRFADGRGVARGIAAGSRNTPSLLDVARHRHFGWDGTQDTLWQQSLRPLADPREMPASDAHVAALIRTDTDLSARYARAFGERPGSADARVTRDIGLALAAYVGTLASPRTPFDDWRDRLSSATSSREPPFPDAARRGLRLFVGRAGCSGCHAGPAFSDDAIHASLVHSLTAEGVPDTGRPGSVSNAFRTPGLRGVAATAPYFHDGSAGRLCDAVRPHAADPGRVRAALANGERRDLVAFLRTLTVDPPAGGSTAC